MSHGGLKYVTPQHGEIYGRYERAYTLVDFAAAASFVVGSILFFFESTQRGGTWLFLVGSLLFMAKPSVRTLREFHLASLPLPGDDED